VICSLVYDHGAYYEAIKMASVQFKRSARLLLRRCNLSDIGGRVYVRVRVSARVIFSITWPPPGHGHLCLTVGMFSVNRKNFG